MQLCVSLMPRPHVRQSDAPNQTVRLIPKYCEPMRLQIHYILQIISVKLAWYVALLRYHSILLHR